MLVFGAAFAGTPHVNVRELDPDAIPAELGFSASRQRLVVDGAVVRGSRHAQLEWLGVVLADDDGAPPAALRLEERHTALRREKAGAGIVTGTCVASLVVGIVVPPAAIVAGVGALAVNGATFALLGPERRRFDGRELAVQVHRLHAVAIADLP